MIPVEHRKRGGLNAPTVSALRNNGLRRTRAVPGRPVPAAVGQRDRACPAPIRAATPPALQEEPELVGRTAKNVHALDYAGKGLTPG